MKPDFTTIFLRDLCQHLLCKEPDRDAIFNLCRLRANYARDEHEELRQATPKLLEQAEKALLWFEKEAADATSVPPLTEYSTKHESGLNTMDVSALRAAIAKANAAGPA